MYALEVYQPRTRKYKRVKQSCGVAYLLRVGRKDYPELNWIIRPLS